MEFFDGFEWAVPTAFASALNAYRFEQGDVLYRSRAAYDDLAQPFATGARAIQVLAPPRGARATATTEAENDRRLASWRADLELQLVDLATGACETRSVSQGRLWMTLWQGREEWLDPEREEPPLPPAARDLAQQLESARPALERMSRVRRGARFLFVVDRASDASRVKAAQVREALDALGSVEQVDLAASESGIDAAACYPPTLLVRSLALAGPPKRTHDAIQEALRDRLYGGTSDATREMTETDEPRTDRFRVARHGLLEAVGEEG